MLLGTWFFCIVKKYSLRLEFLLEESPYLILCTMYFCYWECFFSFYCNWIPHSYLLMTNVMFSHIYFTLSHLIRKYGSLLIVLANISFWLSSNFQYLLNLLSIKLLVEFQGSGCMCAIYWVQGNVFGIIILKWNQILQSHITWYCKGYSEYCLLSVL